MYVSGCNPPSSGKVFVDPQRSGSPNTSTIYIGALSHLLRSDNSGATFHSVLSLSVDLDFGRSTATSENPQAEFIRDAILDPSRPDRLFVATATPACVDSSCGRATSGLSIYRSLDRGVHWNRQDLGTTTAYTTYLGVSANFEGLHVPRAQIAVSPVNADVAAVAFSDEQIGKVRLFRTADGGSTWSERPLPSAALAWPLTIVFSTESANQMYLGSGSVYVSADAGVTWTDLRVPHGDQVQLAFTAGRELLAANDGGIYRASSAGSWTALNSTLSITECYSVAAHPSNALLLAAGTQDNGTTQFAPGLGWTFALGADGGDVVFDPRSEVTRLFAETQWQLDGSSNAYRFARCEAATGCLDKTQTLNTAADGPFIPRMALDQLHPGTLWLTAAYLARTDDAGDHWRAASPSVANLQRCWSDTNGARCAVAAYFTAVAIAPTAPDVVFAGTLNGDVRLTTNGGVDWASIAGANAGPLPVRKVSEIVVDPRDANVAYVAYSGFDSGGSGLGHVFRTSDRGRTWQDLTLNLPDVPVNTLLIDPDSASGSTPRVLYAGTDVGVFRITDNGSSSWQPFGAGLPLVVVTRLAYNAATQQLFAATYGRGVWVLSSRFAR